MVIGSRSIATLASDLRRFVLSISQFVLVYPRPSAVIQVITYSYKVLRAQKSDRHCWATASSTACPLLVRPRFAYFVRCTAVFPSPISFIWSANYMTVTESRYLLTIRKGRLFALNIVMGVPSMTTDVARQWCVTRAEKRFLSKRETRITV